MEFSTRKMRPLRKSRSALRPLLLLASAALVSGCQVRHTTPGPEALNNAPVKIDEAMQIRDWQPTAAEYTSDLVLAGSNYAPLQPIWNGTNRLDAVTQNVAFIGNCFWLPVGLFVYPPWTYLPYKSISMPPTYTAMPPLPDAAEPTPVYTLR
jgi:hypothetical protein